MSWDYEEYTKPCPCGKGLIRVVNGSNDWGQTSHNETILCPDCKEKSERDAAAKSERKRIAEHKIELVLSYFKDNFMGILLSKFENAKSKKAIWKVAYEIGLETYSESSFYQHTKGKTLVLEEYIDSKVSWNNIRKLINSLGVKDSKLEDLYKDAASHIKEFEDEDYRLAYLRAKGRI